MKINALPFCFLALLPFPATELHILAIFTTFAFLEFLPTLLEEVIKFSWEVFELFKVSISCLVFFGGLPLFFLTCNTFWGSISQYHGLFVCLMTSHSVQWIFRSMHRCIALFRWLFHCINDNRVILFKWYGFITCKSRV